MERLAREIPESLINRKLLLNSHLKMSFEIFNHVKTAFLEFKVSFDKNYEIPGLTDLISIIDGQVAEMEKFIMDITAANQFKNEDIDEIDFSDTYEQVIVKIMIWVQNQSHINQAPIMIPNEVLFEFKY